MSMKLRELIRAIRACKTAAEERAVIAKESALIRTSFKEGENAYRMRNLAKLLFIHMMGFPNTASGQLECLRLIASPRFCEKRIGYLGLCQLVDPDSDVLVLMPNSVKNDISHPSQYVTGLALTALGTVGSAETGLTLAKELTDLCNSSNPFIRKKALLCAARCVLLAADETLPRFLPLLAPAFEENSHSVLLAACGLLEAVLAADPAQLPQLQADVLPAVVNCARRAAAAGPAAADLEAGGVVDPFLQVLLVRCVRLLAPGAPAPVAASAQEVVCAVIAATDGAKPAGNAVLFEAALAASALDAKDAASGVLARFLRASRDPNARYVALGALNRPGMLTAVTAPPVAEIRECLKDSDMSIKRVVADVLLKILATPGMLGGGGGAVGGGEAAVGPGGDYAAGSAAGLAAGSAAPVRLEQLFSDLCEVVVGAGAKAAQGSGGALEAREFCRELTGKLLDAARRCAPTLRWQADATIRLFALAAHPEDISAEHRNRLTHLICASPPELRRVATLQLFTAAAAAPPRAAALLVVAAWNVAEHAHLLLQPSPADPTDKFVLSADAVVDFYERLVEAHVGNGGGSPASAAAAAAYGGPAIAANPLLEGPGAAGAPHAALAEVLAVALAKLAVRLPPPALPRLQALLRGLGAKKTAAASAELQQRVAELSLLLDDRRTPPELRAKLLDAVPPFEPLEGVADRPLGDVSAGGALIFPPAAPPKAAGANLLDIAGDAGFGDGGTDAVGSASADAVGGAASGAVGGAASAPVGGAASGAVGGAASGAVGGAGFADFAAPMFSGLPAPTAALSAGNAFAAATPAFPLGLPPDGAGASGHSATGVAPAGASGALPVAGAVAAPGPGGVAISDPGVAGAAPAPAATADPFSSLAAFAGGGAAAAAAAAPGAGGPSETGGALLDF